MIKKIKNKNKNKILKKMKMKKAVLLGDAVLGQY
jgi:hypothetical protein